MFSGIAAITRCVNLAECCTRRYRVDRGAFYRNTGRFASATEKIRARSRIEFDPSKDRGRSADRGSVSFSQARLSAVVIRPA